MKPVFVHPAAEVEADVAFEWYWMRSPQAAQKFEAELRDSFSQVASTPHQYAPFLHGTRRIFLRRFPFFVVFREAPDRIDILAIAHAKRRPAYWLRRESRP